MRTLEFISNASKNIDQRCYFAVRAHDAVFEAAKNLEELMLAQLFSSSR